MKKLLYLFPAVIALGFAGCDDPAGSGGGTEGETEDGTTSVTDPSDSATNPTGITTTGSSTTTDPTIDPDTGGSESSSGGPTGCTADDACTPETVQDDCGANFNCVGCLCVPDGDAPLCPDGWGGGEYADCGNGEACGGELESACVGGTGDASVCLFLGCEELCDCPAPPEGFEDLGRCVDQFGPGGVLDDVNDCFLDCSGGEACPDGMFCDGGVCFVGDGPRPAPGYGDCVNNPGCANANEGCIVDDPADPSLGFCMSGCNEAADCNMAPGTGDAPVTCDDLTGDMMGNCFLDCAGGETCPDGMACAFGSFCAWDVIPDSGYGDCASLPDDVCVGTETCIENTDAGTGTTEICAATDCVDPGADCPDLPETGDAPAACQDIDGAGGDECVLDCSGGQTCPDGAVCNDNGFCSYEVPTFTFLEDFQGGALPADWTVHNVDALTPAAMVNFVTDAWVIADNVAGVTDVGEFWAVSTSWYTPAGVSDDWIISPAITLGATATLQWSAFTVNADFPDGYEVYVVPTTVTEFTDFVGDGDPTAFLALDPVAVPSAAPAFEIAAEEASAQNRSVDLAGLATQEVHVAFRNNSNDALLLLVDNVAVIE